MRKTLDLLVTIAVAFITVKATTFGWRFWGSSTFDSRNKDAHLAENLKQHVYALSHEIGDRSLFEYGQLNKAGEYIARQLASFGYDIEFQDFTVAGKKLKNIIATKMGAQKPQEVFIVGAHYDACANPGADDNASGIAGLLELARIFSHKPTEKTIKFIAFVNEEPPFYNTGAMGSMIYAQRAKAKQEKIKAVIILEMIGYYTHRLNSQRYPPFLGLFFPNRGHFIAVVGNFPSRGLVRAISSVFKKNTKFPMEALFLPSWVPAITFSDHYPFWKEGYPAVMVTDTAFFRNPNHHRSSDTYETLDYPYMAALVDGLVPVLETVAQ